MADLTLPETLKKAEISNCDYCENKGRSCGKSVIPSSVVSSFLETARKELKEMLMDTSYHQLSIRGKSRPDLMKREAAVRFVVAVFGGEEK